MGTATVALVLVHHISMSTGLTYSLSFLPHHSWQLTMWFLELNWLVQIPPPPLTGWGARADL